MIRELNLQCLYKVVFDTETDLYIFHTKNEIEYRVAFEKVDYLPIEHLYSMAIIAVGSEYPPMDVETQNAVREIVKYFFRDEQKVMVYLCAFDDERGMSRHRKFSYWFENDAFSENLVKLDGIIQNSDKFFTSLIYHRNNEHQEYIEEIYKNSILELNHK